MEKKLELFELRRHGETDAEFYALEELFAALIEAGYPVERHFYEDDNFANEEIQSLIEKEGLAVLPVSKMDDKVSFKGRYPTIDEIADYFEITITYEDECHDDCCCGHHHHHDEEEHECCCGGHHHHEGECCCGEEHEEGHECHCHDNEEVVEEHECCCCHNEK